MIATDSLSIVKDSSSIATDRISKSTRRRFAFMPKLLIKQLDREAYCSAPPIMISLRPPRLTRDAEAREPRALLQMPELQVKAEISSIKSFEYESDCKPDIPFDCK